MKIVIFYEKPGCATNAKQKKQLREAGCMILERNLLEHGLKRDELLEFLEPLHVSSWFNPSAPKIKNGEINPDALSKEAALQLLMMEPILIRRPLIVAGGRKMCGFDRGRLEQILEVSFNEPLSEACSGDTATCKND